MVRRSRHFGHVLPAHLCSAIIISFKLSSFEILDVAIEGLERFGIAHRSWGMFAGYAGDVSEEEDDEGKSFHMKLVLLRFTYLDSVSHEST